MIGDSTGTLVSNRRQSCESRSFTVANDSNKATSASNKMKRSANVCISQREDMNPVLVNFVRGKLETVEGETQIQ
jgi:hypothetical protein